MIERIAKRLGRRAAPLAYVMALVQTALAAREHWGLLEAHERARLTELIARSRGRPGRLRSSEREEIVGLVRKLELARLGRRVVSEVSPLPLRRRRR